MRNSHEKIVRAKSLRKLTYDHNRYGFHSTCEVYGKEYDYFPMYGMVFAFTGIKLETLGTQLLELQKDTAPETWIDMVVVLDQGLLMYANPGAAGPESLMVRPGPASALRVVKSQEALTPATLAMQVVFNGVFMEYAMLYPYFGPDDWGTITEVPSPE